MGIELTFKGFYAWRGNIAALYLGQMAAQVDKNEVIPRQVIELITTGKSAGVESVGAKK